MGTVRQETISGVKWSAIEKFSVQGIQFVLGIIMARLLVPSDYGTIGMIGIFIALSSSFIDSGFGNALIRKIDRTETDFSTVFYFNLVVSIICYIGLFVAAPWVGEFFETPVLCPILRVESINLILNAFMGIQTAKLTIDVNFKALAHFAFISTLISGALGVVLAYKGHGVWALVYQNLLSSIINVLLLGYYCKWKPLLVFSWASFKELGSYGSKLLASGLLHTLYSNMTTLIIGKFFSAQDLGYYNRGVHYAQFPVGTANSIVSKVSFPILAKLQNDDEHLIAVYRKYICIMSLVIIFGCMLLAALAKPLILFLLTDKWTEAVIYLQIISFALMFDHICSINLNLLQVKGRSDLFLKLEIIKKTISIGILFASIPFGVIGICVSKIIYTQIAVFINTYYTGKLFNLGYVTQVKDFSGFFFKSLVSCLPAFLLTFMPISNILVLLIGGIISVLLYMWLIRNDASFLEIRDVVKSYFVKEKENKSLS